MDGGVTCFGRFEFDHARGRLSVAGRPVELDRASAAILSALLTENGKDVGKDRLLEAGWPGRVVHENSLAKAIVRLRQALDADAAMLETVHGYGYRLVFEPRETVDSSTLDRVAGLRRSHGAALLAGTVLLIGLAALSLALLSSGAPRAEAQRLVKGEAADSIGRVLWVDDHPPNNVREKRFLETRKIAVYQVETSEDALALLAMYEYGAVISDMNRNGKPLAGIKLVGEMRRRRDRTPFIVYTVVPSAAQRKLVAEAGGQRAVATPAELYDAVLPLFQNEKARPAK